MLAKKYHEVEHLSSLGGFVLFSIYFYVEICTPADTLVLAKVGGWVEQFRFYTI